MEHNVVYIGNTRCKLYVGSSRRCVVTESAAPSASSYVQDGLIALYDGIENAGAGVHDASATSWLNLANTSESITGIDNTFTWGDDYLLPPVTAAVGVIPAYNPVTIEAVLTFSGTNFIPVIVFSSVRDLWISIRANDTVNFFSGCHYAPVQRGVKTALSAIGLITGTTRTNPSAIYVNGVDSIVKSNGGTLVTYTRNSFNAVFSYGTGTAYWYCLRLYNRVLTEQEILANYNIDKVRFGLT